MALSTSALKSLISDRVLWPQVHPQNFAVPAWMLLARYNGEVLECVACSHAENERTSVME
jgi:hypothetical protein